MRKLCLSCRGLREGLASIPGAGQEGDQVELKGWGGGRGLARDAGDTEGWSGTGQGRRGMEDVDPLL